jgi:uncharacterized protein YkwD
VLSNQQIRAAVRAAQQRLPQHLRDPRVLARVAVAALAVGVALGASSSGGASATPTPAAIRPDSLLPESVGAGITTLQPIRISFPQAMDPLSVESALAVMPRTAYATSWTGDSRTLVLTPTSRWQMDARYLVSVPGTVLTAGGQALGEARQASFTTQTAPVVNEFQVRYAGESAEQRVHARMDQEMAAAAAATLATPVDTTADVSAETSISLGFSVPVDKQDVEASFRIRPAVEGALSWEGNSLVFTPSERLKPNARYSVSVLGAHDTMGNRLGGDLSYSFTTRVGAQVVKISPSRSATNVADSQVVLWFSQPMDAEPTRAALSITDASSGATVTGTSAWNDARTQIRFVFAKALPLGHTYKVTLDEGAHDTDGNVVTASWTFSTAPAPVAAAAAPRAITSGPAAPADLVQYALWQVNQDRAQYGFAPLSLDSAISSVASAHAWDMINYGYFSHTGRDGSRVAGRLRSAGIGFSYSGENLCYYNGIGVKSMLNWCNSTFMAEPYPGYFNHKGNILNPQFSRLGVGIAQSGGKVIIVWNFAG